VGRFVAGFAAGIGACNALKAELWAVRYGLDLTGSLGARFLNLKVDSQVLKLILFKDQVDLGPNLCSALGPFVKKKVLKYPCITVAEFPRCLPRVTVPGNPTQSNSAPI
jgi:hypothetical protein